jgi:hypothetical protein
MTSVSQYGANRGMLAEISEASLCPSDKSETRIDIALLVSALFLQRFSLPFRGTWLGPCPRLCDRIYAVQ